MTLDCRAIADGRTQSPCLLFPRWFNSRFGFRRGDCTPAAALVRQEGERHAKADHVFRLEPLHFLAGLRVRQCLVFVAGAAESAPRHLLAQQLVGNGRQADDMGHRHGIPTRGQYADGSHLLNLLARFANGVHRLTQPLRMIRIGQLFLPGCVFLGGGILRYVLCLGEVEHFGVKVQGQLGRQSPCGWPR